MYEIPPARIQIVTGPMFSGKTEELIRRVSNERTAGHRVQIFYPKLDTRPRDDPTILTIQSHRGKSLEAIPVQAPEEILSLLAKETSVVAIDEIQFFNSKVFVSLCNVLLSQGKRIIAAGLDTDFRGEPFDVVVSIASQVRIERFQGRCAVCGLPADFTQRLINNEPAPYDSPVIMVGGTELYEPRCPRHHVVPGRRVGVKSKIGVGENRIDNDLLETTDVTQQLDHWIDRLQAIARTGLGYSIDDPQRYFDLERYEELLKLAAEMKAFTFDGRLSIDRDRLDGFNNDWRAQVRPAQQGYVTPKVTAAGAVFNEKDEILLVRRKSSPYWDLPGGWCDIGYSSAEVVVKEITEETGLRTRPLRLIGVYDSQRWGFLSGTQLYCLVFYCQLDGGELQPNSEEIEAVGFFAGGSLPSLLPGVQPSIQHAFGVHEGRVDGAYFDYFAFESLK